MSVENRTVERLYQRSWLKEWVQPSYIFSRSHDVLWPMTACLLLSRYNIHIFLWWSTNVWHFKSMMYCVGLNITSQTRNLTEFPHSIYKQCKYVWTTTESTHPIHSLSERHSRIYFLEVKKYLYGRRMKYTPFPKVTQNPKTLPSQGTQQHHVLLYVCNYRYRYRKLSYLG